MRAFGAAKQAQSLEITMATIAAHPAIVLDFAVAAIVADRAACLC